MIPPAIQQAWLRKTVRRRARERRGLVVELQWKRGRCFARVRWHGADGQPDYFRQAEAVAIRELEVVG